jgi:hypothetical protein
MFESFTLRLTVLTLLLAYLCIKFLNRLRAEEAQRLAREKEAEAERQARWNKSFAEDSPVARLAPRLQRVREDYFAAQRSRPHDFFYRKGLLARARQAIMDLSFFRRARITKG